jgi:hypothetical protein
MKMSVVVTSRALVEPKQHSVRFSTEPRVVEYRLSTHERLLKREGSALLNAEHQRERKLYLLVLGWKTRVEAKQGEVRPLTAGTSLASFLGEQRAETARALGVGNVVELCQHAANFALDQWPSCDVRDDRDFELTSTIVLSLVAEFLCKHLVYKLEDEQEQDCMLYNVFQLAQQILASHFS